MNDRLEIETYSIDIGDWPGGSLVAIDCAYGGAPDGGLDLVLPVTCRRHWRSIWWCPNAGVLWCDGGPPQFTHHVWSVEDDA